MPLEQRLRIERLLYVFPEPLNKEKDFKNFKFNNLTKPTPHKLIFYQKCLLELLVESLDTFMDLYQENGKAVLQHLPDISSEYFLLNLSIKDIENHPEFPQKRLYAINIRPFNSRENDPELLIKNWKEQRSSVINQIALLKNYLVLNPYAESERPQLFNEFVTTLQKKLNLLKEKLEKNKQNATYGNKDIEITTLPGTFKQDENDLLLFYLGDFGKIRMVSKNSSPTIILQMQIAERGNLVSVREMLKEINLKRKSTQKPLVADDVRRKIAQLNKRLANVTNGQVEIRESGQGSYHLWYNDKA